MNPKSLLISLSNSLKKRDIKEELVDQFIDQLTFCFLLESCQAFVPGVPFQTTIHDIGRNPEKISLCITNLFNILGFNGSLVWGPRGKPEGFFDKIDINLTIQEVDLIRELIKVDWSKVSPLIFGEVLEQDINTDKRIKLGSHYTPEKEIKDLIEPVIFRGLKEEWLTISRDSSADLAYAFLEKLRRIKILDPSCGSGNFLLFCLFELLDLERQVILTLSGKSNCNLHSVSLDQFYGIEKSRRAYILSYFSLWIARLQWYRDYRVASNPLNSILFDRPNIINADAVIDLSDPMLPRETVWPEVDYIIGNPPFLASWRMREYLGGDYCDTLKWIYESRIPSSSDFGVYWFEKARDHIDRGRAKTVGFVMSVSIKYGYSRYVLDRVSSSCKIFFAISKRLWDGDANVDICLIGFCSRDDQRACILDGKLVQEIYSNLSDDYNISQVNNSLNISKDALTGTGKNWSSLCIDSEEAYDFLRRSSPEANDFIRPFVGGMDLAQGDSDSWIKFTEDPDPKDYLIMRSGRYLASPRTSKHSTFMWMDSVILPDDGVFYVDTDDDFYLGLLQSSIHRVWTLANCGWRGTSRRYKTFACFKAFPFPELEGKEEIIDNLRVSAKELHQKRYEWLYPSGLLKTEIWRFEASRSGPWSGYKKEDLSSNSCVIEYPRRVPINSVARELLRKKFFTNLYNLNPSWLVECQRKIDEQVSLLYEVDGISSDQEILRMLISLKSRES